MCSKQTGRAGKEGGHPCPKSKKDGQAGLERCGSDSKPGSSSQLQGIG